MLAKPANFFKHANRQGQSAEQSIDFDPTANRLLILVSISAIESLGHELNALETAFVLYVKLHDPTDEYASFLAEKGIPIDHVQSAATVPKPQFLRAIVDLFERSQ